MLYRELSISGAWVVEVDPLTDVRGFFARTFCSGEFAARGLPHSFVQSSISYNAKRATLRGLHFQREPSKEIKLVRCTAGAIYDVVLDLRPASQTFRQWVAVELSAANRTALVVPHGCAHGFITLTDESEVLYMMSEPQAAALASGVRWDDPAFGIKWPLVPQVISDRDATYPDFIPQIAGGA